MGTSGLPAEQIGVSDYLWAKVEQIQNMKTNPEAVVIGQVSLEFFQPHFAFHISSWATYHKVLSLPHLPFFSLLTRVCPLRTLS